MKNFTIISMVFLCCFLSCNRSPQIIELPYHEECTGKDVLIVNTPSDSLELWRFLLKYYKDNKLHYARFSKHFFEIDFYLKNSTTSYFINHPDDPGGFSTDVLHDYYYGDDQFPRFGIGAIIMKRAKKDSSKYIFEIEHFQILKNKWVYDPLRDESKRGWYQQHRGNELVRLFNQGEPFPLDSIQTDTLASKKQMLNKPKARGKVRKRGTKN